MPSEIDALLITWARWSIYRMDSGLGYSKTTSLGRAMEQGPAPRLSWRALRHTDEEHALWSTPADTDDMLRRERKRGYLDGLQAEG